MSDPAATLVPRPALNDCWNRIGVRGDRSCPELSQHVHCHNCPVYTAAAVDLLDTGIPSDYLAEWTRHFAREKPVAELGTHSVVIFRLGVEWFALPVHIFKEISETKIIHSLPHRKNKSVLGLVNIRGELLICVSLAETLRLEIAPETKPEKDHDAHAYLLVLSHEGRRLVFPVDEVAGMHRYRLKDVQEVPATVAGARATHTTGLLVWQGKSVGCLDEQRLLSLLNQNLA